MMIDIRVLGALAVGRLAPASQGRYHDGLQLRPLAHLACYLVSIHVRHADVEENYREYDREGALGHVER